MKHRYNPEGFRNPQDIIDNPSMEELRREFEEFDRFHECIERHFEVEDMSPEMKERYEQFEKDAVECVKAWKERIERLIQEESRISDRIEAYLREKGLLLPKFDVFTGEGADEKLERFQFGSDETKDQPDNAMLVVFNTPKPIEQFWWKGGAGDWGDKAQDTRRMVIEWGRIYRDVIKTVWDMTDYGDTYFDRLNPEGVHEEGEYYYVWKIRE
jgi:hypothetical protein